MIAKHQASIALLERAKQKKMVERAMIMSNQEALHHGGRGPHGAVSCLTDH
jgi:hypothetical protein